MAGPSPCPERPPLEKVIDDHGDVRIRVGQNRCCGRRKKHHHETTTVFTVCSHILGRASPVFRAMFFSGFIEAQKHRAPDVPWTADFPDDNVEAMELLLCVTHYKFDAIPRTLPSTSQQCDTARLCQLAVLTDKYQCTHLWQPWISFWLRKSEYQASDPACLQRWAWISWVFGDAERFERTLLDLIRHCRYPKPSLSVELAPEPYGLWGKVLSVVVLFRPVRR